MSKAFVGALFIGGLAFGCSAEPGNSGQGASGEQLGVVSQALMTPQSFTMTGAYYPDSGSSCSSSSPKNIAGFEPAEPGTYPVFIYLTGTTMPFNGADAQDLMTEMTKRGYVSATVQYPNGMYPFSCGTMTQRAKCLFDSTSAHSAVAQICSRAKADCNGRGILVSGFSQGANLSSLAKNYDSRVRAAYLLGHGGIGAAGINLQSCLQKSANVFASSQMRVVNGESDQFFGSNAGGVRNQLNIATALSCTGYNCLQADGSGWYMIANTEVSDGKADHCYFYSGANSTCSSYSSMDSGWDTGSAAWQKMADLTWLASMAP